MTTPDLAGYRAALEQKRELMGQMVTFIFPSTPTWPEGTVLNPATGRPYDPLIKPTKEEAPDPIELRASVAFRPTFQEDTDETEVGDIKMNVALIWVNFKQWEEVEDAAVFEVKGDEYLIRKVTEDGIGEDFRMLIWGERAGEADGS